MEKINSDEYKQIKLISQGTYGCIFKKGLTCDGMVDETNTISKIQEKNETSENEVNMGKKIMEIPNYQEHFAPIIESCEVDISKIESAEINKCNFIKSYKNRKTYNIIDNYINNIYRGAFGSKINIYGNYDYIKTIDSIIYYNSLNDNNDVKKY